MNGHQFISMQRHRDSDRVDGNKTNRERCSHSHGLLGEQKEDKENMPVSKNFSFSLLFCVPDSDIAYRLFQALIFHYFSCWNPAINRIEKIISKNDKEAHVLMGATEVRPSHFRLMHLQWRIRLRCIAIACLFCRNENNETRKQSENTELRSRKQQVFSVILLPSIIQ